MDGRTDGRTTDGRRADGAVKVKRMEELINECLNKLKIHLHFSFLALHFNTLLQFLLSTLNK